ncbi:MAG: hypothetical protein AAFP19_14925 [Bacteroidota bacterium]
MISSIRLIAVIFLFPIALQAQIQLQNPSFESTPQDATVPVGWYACDVGTTPDILPGFWGVYTEPSDGETFMGLITREDGTWESVGQRLSKSMENGKCYSFSLQLAHSETYTGYNMPVKLRIWGGGKKRSKDQLLAETGPIEHTDWQDYTFYLNPKGNYNYLIIEAHYIDGVFFSYKGNVLVDGCSPITACKRADNAEPIDSEDVDKT